MTLNNILSQIKFFSVNQRTLKIKLERSQIETCELSSKKKEVSWFLRNSNPFIIQGAEKCYLIWLSLSNSVATKINFLTQSQKYPQIKSSWRYHRSCFRCFYRHQPLQYPSYIHALRSECISCIRPPHRIPCNGYYDYPHYSQGST